MEEPISKSVHSTKIGGLFSSRFDSEEVMGYYEDAMENLSEVAEDYGREFDYDGLSYGRVHDFGSEEISTAKSLSEARQLELQGFELLGNSRNLFEADPSEFRSGDGAIQGHFVYKPGHYYRGANVAGRVTVRVEPNEAIGEEEQQDLEEAVDSALEGDGWELPI